MLRTSLDFSQDLYETRIALDDYLKNNTQLDNYVMNFERITKRILEIHLIIVYEFS